MKCKHVFPMMAHGEEFDDFCRYDADGLALCPQCGKPAKKIVAEMAAEIKKLKRKISEFTAMKK